MFADKLNIEQALVQIDTLLKPYLYLDKTKTNGMDMRHKFSNSGLGVPAETVDFLKKVAVESSSWNLTLDQRIKITDVLVLYSNHLDQHNDASQNAKLPAQVNKTLVLNFLQAGFKLFAQKPALDVAHARALSTFAQFMHYYGKALRYNDTPLQQRTETLKEALEICIFLDSKKLDETLDPHQFGSRKITYETPLIFGYQDLGQYNEALALLENQKNTAPDNFHKAQALIQIAQTFRLKKEPKTGIENAKEAMLVAKTEKSLIMYNAKLALMECYWAADDKDEAVALAKGILADQEKNPNCGTKDAHIKAATTIVEEFNRDASLSFI